MSHGLVGDRLYVAVWTRRQERRRVISLRKANAREIRAARETQPALHVIVTGTIRHGRMR